MKNCDIIEASIESKPLTHARMCIDETCYIAKERSWEGSYCICLSVRVKGSRRASN